MTTLCFRNWYSQESTIVHCFKSNYKLAEKCWSKVIEEDLTGVGECLSSYWEIKRTLAPGSEPQLVTSILDTLKPFIVGGSLAGAGGGGFLAAILREGADRAAAVEEVRCVRCWSLIGQHLQYQYSLLIGQETSGHGEAHLPHGLSGHGGDHRQGRRGARHHQDVRRVGRYIIQLLKLSLKFGAEVFYC